MSNFEIDDEKEIEKDIRPDLKHDLEENRESPRKSETESASELPPHLRELEDTYAKPKIVKAVTDLVDKAYNEIVEHAHTKFWPEFEKEANGLEPAPFTKDIDLPEGLEALEDKFNLTSENLALEFNNEKMKIVTQIEAEFIKNLNSVLAKNNTYQRLLTAYNTHLEASSKIDPETLYAHKCEQLELIQAYAKDKDDFLKSVSEQYDLEHLPELTLELETHSNELIESVMKIVEEKVSPTKIVLGNTLIPEFTKRKGPMLVKLQTELDLLEQKNDTQTGLAINDFKRSVRRATRTSQQNKAQIEIKEIIRDYYPQPGSLQPFDLKSEIKTLTDDIVIPEFKSTTVEKPIEPVVENVESQTHVSTPDSFGQQIENVLNAPLATIEPDLFSGFASTETVAQAAPVATEPVAPIAPVATEPVAPIAPVATEPVAPIAPVEQDIFAGIGSTEPVAQDPFAKISEPTVATEPVVQDVATGSKMVDPFRVETPETKATVTDVEPTETKEPVGIYDPFNFETPTEDTTKVESVSTLSDDDFLKQIDTDFSPAMPVDETFTPTDNTVKEPTTEEESPKTSDEAAMLDIFSAIDM